MGKERCYDPRFLITEPQYHRCFDEDEGYERVVGEVLRKNGRILQELSVRLGILGYLVRGAYADTIMRTLLACIEGQYFEERWEQGGVLIFDNARVFHARYGGNITPLKRNFCI